jgi:hypothetical protein
MKKGKVLLVLSLAFCAISVSSCSPTAVSEKLSVEIGGPKSVDVGSKINLVADVINSDDDSVTWESLDSTIAKVSDTGVVTGVKSGEVKIKATFTGDIEIFGTYTITVVSPKATSVKLVMPTDDKITYDAETTTYSVPLSHSFKVGYELLPSNTRAPESVLYSVSFENGDTSDGSFSIDETTGVVSPDEVINGVTLFVSISYKDTTAAIKGSIRLNVLDNNIDSKNAIIDKFDTLKTNEKTSLKSATLIRKSTVNETVNSVIQKTVTEKTMSFKSFDKVNYTMVSSSSKVDNADAVVSNFGYYNGLYNSHHYAFEFENSSGLNVKNVFANGTAAPTDEDYNYVLDYSAKTLDYSISGIFLKDIFNASNLSNGPFFGFGNSRVYGNSTFTLGADAYTVKAEYSPINTENKYTLDLSIALNNGAISSYVFTETSLVNGLESTYSEELKDMVFAEKIADSKENNSDFVDINSLYMTSFKAKEIAGTKTDKYDYTDLTKYGSDSITEKDSLTKYVLALDKTLVLKVSDFAPTTANMFIDEVSCVSSDSSQIKSVSTTGENIFAISANKNNSGAGVVGEAKFTMTSNLGFTYSFYVEFVSIIYKSVLVSGLSTGVTTLGDAYVDGLSSSNFYLNSVPDDVYAGLTYGLNITSGTANGIKLYQYEHGNADGLSGYTIKGLIAGTYKFKFFINDFSAATSGEYSITIKPKLTKEAITAGIVGKSYSYSTGTITDKVTFTSATSFRVDENKYTEDIFGTFAYSISDGSITIDSSTKVTDPNGKEGVPFVKDATSTGATYGFYYAYLRVGEIKFSTDFSNITLYVCASNTPATGQTVQYMSFYPVVFTLDK